MNSLEEYLAMTEYLLTHDAKRTAIGAAGTEHGRAHSLLPCLLRDELALIASVLQTPCHATATPSTPKVRIAHG